MSETYTGRLCWDHDTATHREMVRGVVNVPVQLEDGTWGNEQQETDVAGREVVTDDAGQTWRYREEGDPSHRQRYESPQPNPVISATTPPPVGYGLDHPDAHHYMPLPHDPHRDGITSHDDAAAVTVTGHTDAWKEQG